MEEKCRNCLWFTDCICVVCEEEKTGICLTKRKHVSKESDC